MNEQEQICWVAGLFEGEGSVYKQKGRLRVSIEMTDLDVIETVQKLFGGSVSKRIPKKSHWKISWKWRLTNNKESTAFLIKILPFLHERRTARIKELMVLSTTG
jgi:intein/homing endonuclease